MSHCHPFTYARLLNKRYGRVGDSPLIGAGTYANHVCAVSGTGHGEFFIRHAVAHVIALDRHGRVAMPHSTEGLFWALARADGRVETNVCHMVVE